MANDDAGGKPADAGGKPANDATGGKPDAPVWDTWYPSQPDEVRSMIDGNTAGLKSALEAERAQRKAIEADLKKLSKGLEGDALAQLEGIQSRLASETQRASFYESAAAAGVTDFKLAYVAARESGALTDSGGCDFAQLKAQHPSLFKPTADPPGHAGRGAGKRRNGGTMDANTALRTLLGATTA